MWHEETTGKGQPRLCTWVTYSLVKGVDMGENHGPSESAGGRISLSVSTRQSSTFSWVYPVGESCGCSCHPGPQSRRPKARCLPVWMAVSTLQICSPTTPAGPRFDQIKAAFLSLKRNTPIFKDTQVGVGGWMDGTFLYLKKRLLAISLFGCNFPTF